MLIPIEWLKQYVKTDKSDTDIADILTLSGTNIDSCQNGVLRAEITANRADCLSIYGIGRELAAVADLQLEDLDVPAISSGHEEIIKPKILDNDICYRYSGYVIKNVSQKESPDWIKKRLLASGMRPINNIVDVTNYIMLETGQPLHAFDADKIINGEMVIRRAKQGEKVKTLDGVDRSVGNDAIVIENNGQLIDLAGIMGGADSEVDEKTKNIFIQSAVFNPILIRRTSKQTKLSTEASYRYERGVDMEKCPDYLAMAAKLILDAGGEVAQSIDIYPSPFKAYAITWDLKKAESLLGVEIDAAIAIKNLNRLGINTTYKEGSLYQSETPSWRVDLCLPEDIYEEVIRFYPVNNLPRTALQKTEPNPNLSDYSFGESLKDCLAEAGLTEIYGYSFISAKELAKAKLDTASAIKIDNPLSEEYQYLRPNLLVDMLTAVFRNPSFDPVAIFEVGHVFPKSGEETHLGIMIAGRGAKYLEDVVEKLLESLETKVDYKIAAIDSTILTSFKVRKAEVRFVELNLAELKQHSRKTAFNYQISAMNQKYEPIAKFPSVNRDIAIIVSADTNPDEIIKKIKQSAPLVKNVELFDTFVSDKFGSNNKSIALHIYYQSEDKTLTDKDVNALQDKVLAELADKFDAKLRQ